MIQYMCMNTEIILNKNGEVRKVHDFRKRVRYDKNYLLIDQALESELLRTDLMSMRLYGSPLQYGMLIDSNDKDVLSFSTGETIQYVNPGVR